MKRIVTTHYRYRRPSRVKQPATLAVPKVVTIRDRKRRETSAPEPAPREAKAGSASANDNGKPTIVIASKPGKWRSDAADMTAEEHRRRGDAADAVFREIKRRIAADGAAKKKS